ncbi:STAS domain-containing protein [Klenkia brasiliensis]|uniref:Anti-anti-sigma factor n=1 Tax=Klenkia brasiliensis TaxID=333142 RepID=A0A1G7N7N0_9ACTN|nr:STAS domain-containing protein [Klenkia brasiliensis]SDF69359.1 anti-anti-sigma factor [Klenkia brasiliensis]
MSTDPTDPAGLTSPVVERAVHTEMGSITLVDGALRLSGEIDAHLCGTWRGSGTDLSGVQVVDAREVTFLGSSGLALLAEVARAHGRGVPLWTAQRAVLRPLRMTGLEPLFDVRDPAT